MIFDGDLEAHVAGDGAYVAEDFDGVFDAGLFHAAGGLAIGGGALKGADELGIGELGGAENAGELLLGGAVLTKAVDVGQTERMPISTSMPSSAARAPTFLTWSSSSEPRKRISEKWTVLAPNFEQ